METVQSAIESTAPASNGLVKRTLIVGGINWAYFLPYVLVKPTTNSLSGLLAGAFGSSLLFLIVPLFPILFFQRRRPDGGLLLALGWGAGIAAAFFVERWFSVYANAHW